MGPPVQQRCGHTGKSAIEGYQDDQEIRTPFLQGDAERVGTAQLKKGRLRKALINVYRQYAKKMEPSYFQWCPVPGKEAEVPSKLQDLRWK